MGWFSISTHRLLPTVECFLAEMRVGLEGVGRFWRVGLGGLDPGRGGGGWMRGFLGGGGVGRRGIGEGGWGIGWVRIVSICCNPAPTLGSRGGGGVCWHQMGVYR